MRRSSQDLRTRSHGRILQMRLRRLALHAVGQSAFTRGRDSCSSQSTRLLPTRQARTSLSQSGSSMQSDIGSTEPCAARLGGAEVIQLERRVAAKKVTSLHEATISAEKLSSKRRSLVHVQRSAAESPSSRRTPRMACPVFHATRLGHRPSPIGRQRILPGMGAVCQGSPIARSARGRFVSLGGEPGSGAAEAGVVTEPVPSSQVLRVAVEGTSEAAEGSPCR